MYFLYIIIVLKKSITQLEEEMNDLRIQHEKDNTNLQQLRDEYENKVGMLELQNKQDTRNYHMEMDNKDLEINNAKKMNNHLNDEVLIILYLA